MQDTPASPAVPVKPASQYGLWVVVLASLLAIYCLVPIGALATCLYVMAFDSAGWFIEDVPLIQPIRMVATEPLSPLAVLQQLIVPIAAGLSGANFINVIRSRAQLPLIIVCILAIVAAVVLSLLFQWRAGFPAAEVRTIQTYFNGIANTVAAYLLFLLGLRETAAAKGASP